jgi:four helix bundle protein
MSTINRFEDIEAWQTARELTKTVYQLTASGALAGDSSLQDQMRRAAVSIMSNIAEGFESRTNALFVELLGRAKGSSGELRAQFYIAHDAGYISPAQLQSFRDQCEKCSSQISRLLTYLKSLPNYKRVSSSSKVSNVPTFKRSNDV